MANVTVFCFLASYAVVFLLELSRLLGRSRLGRASLIGMAIAGFVAHTWYLFNRSGQTHLPPLLSSTHDWMLVLAWIVVLCYLVLIVAQRELAVGAFALPVVLVMVLSTYFLNQAPPAELAIDRAQRGWVLLHAALLVFGVTAGSAGLVSGVMYLIQHRRLKTRHAEHTGFRIPSLARLARVNYWSVVFAFVFLTLGFASGLYMGLRPPVAGSSVGLTDPAVLTSAAVWLLLAVLLARLGTQRNPSGRQVAWLTVLGCGAILLTVIGLQVILGSVHGSAARAAVNAPVEV
jgi:ABC-type uncharacterized transport system permease subunit